MLNKILSKIEYNINYKKKDSKPGMIIASISENNPNYIFHWTRDASIIYKVIINEFIKNNQMKYFEYIINYIDNEYYLQSINNLGEPKFNIDGSNFRGEWGRPQNDGPALRGLNMIKLYDYFIKLNYKTLANNIILPIIQNDIIYISENINSPCFDLWEEIYGFHFYTLIVQCKFVKEYNYLAHKYNFQKYHIFDELKSKINIHLRNNQIISSFDVNDNIIREYDTSVFLGLCHIDFDTDIVNYKTKDFLKYSEEIISIFKNEYKINNNDECIFLGRYPNDNYFGGNPWIITTLGFLQFLRKIKLNVINNIDKDYFINNIYSKILFLDNDLNLAEQLDKNTFNMISAKNLTWNYAELYFFLNNNI